MIFTMPTLENYKKLYKSKNYCIIDSDMKENEINDYFGRLSDCEKVSTNKFYIYYDKTKCEVSPISGVGDFVNSVIKEKKNHSESLFYYRGHSKWEYTLLPSIYRDNYIRNEHNIFRDIISQKPQFFEGCNTTLETLVKMQHFGIPTRLLDLTENPLIALFFSCVSNENLHGEVLTFNINKKFVKYYDSDTVDVLSNLSKVDNNFNLLDTNFEFQDAFEKDYLEQPEHFFREDYDEYIKNFNELDEIKRMVHFIREDKPYFKNRINPVHLNNYSLVVKPKLSNDRIINQSGAFILFGINKNKSCCSDMSKIINNSFQKIYIIPSNVKKEILKELELFNINHSTVYCDLESTAKYFKNKYKG